MKNVLIIGGAGYIGSALSKYLTDIKVVAECIDPDDHHELNDPYTYTQLYAVNTVDLEWFGNVNKVNNVVMDYRHLTREQLAKYDVVILLAAFSSVPMAVKSNPADVVRNNVMNFMDLLAKLTPRHRFIYAGSSSVYNGIGEAAHEGDDLLPPSNVYDATKRHIDELIENYPAHLDYFGLRLGTVNGMAPHLRTDIMINGMVKSVIETGAITVANRHIRRPILGIKDLCRAIRAIIDTPTVSGGIYNLASFNATVGNIAADVESYFGCDVNEGSAPHNVVPYDFAIDRTKFIDAFKFEYRDTVQSIASNVFNGYHRAIRTDRLTAKVYNV